MLAISPGRICYCTIGNKVNGLGPLDSRGQLSLHEHRATPPAASRFLSPASALRRKTSDIPRIGGSTPAPYRSKDACGGSCRARVRDSAKLHLRLILPERS